MHTIKYPGAETWGRLTLVRNFNVLSAFLADVLIYANEPWGSTKGWERLYEFDDHQILKKNCETQT
jgi:hypothetical protein